MYVSWGKFKHELGATAVSIVRESIFAEGTKTPIGYEERWDIQGWVQASTQGGLQAKIKQLEAAYSTAPGQQGKDLILWLPDGSKSAHAMLSKESTTGTRIVTPVHFPEGRGVEGVTYRSFNVGIAAEFRSFAGSNFIVSFQETISFTGGGPLDIYIETLRGLPIKQRAREHTIYRAMQFGQAVGYSGYLTYPKPVWPQAFIEPMAQKESASPTPSGENGKTEHRNYPITWRYEFQSDRSLTGKPTPWKM